MVRYMSQDLFTTLVVGLAWMQRLHVHDVSRCRGAIDTALLKYREFYTDDAFEVELWPTADAFDQWLADVYPYPPEQLAWMKCFARGLGTVRSKRDAQAPAAVQRPLVHLCTLATRGSHAI